MIGTVVAEGYGFGVVAAGDERFTFLPAARKTPISLFDEVDFWLDDNPRGGLAAVDVARRVPPASVPRLFVGNIDAAASRGALLAALEALGGVAWLLAFPGRTYAFVDFESRDAVKCALTGVPVWTCPHF